MARRKHKRYILLFSFLSTLFLNLLFSLPIFRQVENVTYDWRMDMLQDSNIPTGKVALIFIDDKTLSSLGTWPLSRVWYAGLTEILAEMGARGIIFDMVFIDGKGEEDKQFAAAMRRAGKVILPFYMGNLDIRKGSFDSVVYPVSELNDAAVSTGYINSSVDRDGKIRTYLVSVESDGGTYDSLGIAAVKEFFGAKEVSRGINYMEIEAAGSGKQRIPFNGNKAAFINFYHDLSEFPNYSFIQVFQSYLQLTRGETSLIPEDSFKDKVVIIGSVATGASDTGRISGINGEYLKNYPLMGVHASFIENFLQGRFIRKGNGIYNFMLPLLFSNVAGYLASFSMITGIVSLLGISGIFIIFSIYLFVARLLWVDIFPVIGAIFLVYLAVLIFQNISERKEKQRVRNLFGKYVSPDVMEKVLGQDQEISLFGEKKNLTVLFADIRGFTSFSERNTPEDTFVFLNRILSIMTGAVFKHKGTLDKFIGDEVMAIYGAPVEDPDHQLHAVLSAVDMMKDVRDFTSDVQIGIGINTGEMMIGNVGTEKRMEYTVIGDAVNLAARIEGETGGGDIFIGEETYESVREKVKCEHLGEFEVKGKRNKVSIYRVIL